jgi:outer membrane protein assembly factor BamB
VGYDGKIYLCSQDGAIYALGGNGSELWSFKTRGPAKLSSPILATPVIDKNKTIYVAGLYDPNLYALDTNNGSVKWACNFDPCDSSHGQIFAAPAIGPDGTVYQTLIGDQNLYALDPCNGGILWKTSLQQGSDTNSSGWSSPVVGANGTIYVSFDDPYLRAVEPNGAIKWVTRLGMIGGFTLSIDKNSLIYAASDDNFVCVVEPNGSEISRFQGNGWVTFPAITDDGTLIVSDANNRIWAISNQDCYFQPAALHRPGDVDSSWTVNFMDFAIMANSWLDCTNPRDASCDDSITSFGIYSMGDIDRNYYADYEDIAFLAANWLMEAGL